MKSMGTFAGFHWYTLYQSCGRKFYFRSILGYVPRFTPPPLINGTCFHLGKETFYRTGKEDRAQKVMMAELLDAKPHVEFNEDFLIMRARLPLMLSSWIRAHGAADLKNYTFLALEREFTIPFANGFVATVRPDAVVQDRNGLIFILETKTSAASANLTEISVAFGDQATVQLAAARRAWPKLSIAGVIPDILFWLRSSRSAREIRCVRGFLVTRTKEQTDEWERSTASLLSEISQKALAVERGVEPVVLFRRNTEFCVSYNKNCEYLHICRESLDLPRGRAPTGFTLDSALSRTPAKKGKKQ
jgi:hypothetical protein